jgi:hypothetical protein
MRPLRNAQVKALFDIADGHYQLAYRGFHALLLTVALLLFTHALRVRTWADFAAAMFALTVLTGLHTFRGLVREAFPINHFLEMVVFCLIALSLAQSRGRWWNDIAAALVFIAASLTLESGLLVWVVAVAAFACGMRGVSTRGIAIMTMLLGVYFGVRFLYLDVGAPTLQDRNSGFGISMLEIDELTRRFGDDPKWFYAYNVATSVLSVLFSDPDRGVFHTVRTWIEGEIPVRLYVAVLPSIATTGLIAWAAIRRFRYLKTLSPADAFLWIFAVVLIANAVISYAYTKHEIMSVAGTFYALATFAAARHLIEYLQHARPGATIHATGLCVTLAMLAAVWAFRSAGVHHMIQMQAFKERIEWARLDTDRLSERGYPSDARARALAARLRRDALETPMANPSLLPGWADRWWGWWGD